MNISADILWIVGGCIVFGIIGGYLSVFKRRGDLVEEDKTKIQVVADRLISHLVLCRIRKVGLEENQELAEEVGLDWFNKNEWPSDPQTIRLMVLANRKSRVEATLVELRQAIAHYGQSNLSNEIMSPLSRLIEHARQYIDVADRCIDKGEIDSVSFSILYSEQMGDDELVLSTLRVEISRAFTTAGVQAMMRFIGGKSKE
ncbi:MAG: hypothetical protein JKX70_11815 [Phycisphaerales bacterium]|nr:hypothetical protein [Phycisphaerales bacterium]